MTNTTIQTKTFWRTLLDAFGVLNRRQWQAPWRDRSLF